MPDRPPGIRLALLDDNPFVRWEGRVHPVNATFHLFLAAVVEAAGPDFRRVDYLVPVRDAAGPPATLPVAPSLRVVPTAPFEGIAGYVRRAPALVAANLAPLTRSIRRADLLWLKLPASNGPLAAAIAVAAGVPRFAYLAGSVARVAGAQRRSGPAGLAARLGGLVYDGASELIALSGERLVVGQGIERGEGVVTSIVAAAELARLEPGAPWPREPGRLRLAWSGRIAAGKGLDELVEALGALVADEAAGGPRVELVLIGSGPAEAALRRRAEAAAVAERIEWAGYLAERAAYRARLAAADLFVFPSVAEGFPKAVLEAMAAGLPVVAARSGAVEPVLGDGERGILLPEGDAAALAAAVRRLAADPSSADRLRRAGLAFAAEHTREREAARLVGWLKARFPDLPWASHGGR